MPITVVYATEGAPTSIQRSIFLAGPTPRSKEVKSWRPDALRILEEEGFDGVVFIPEPRDGEWRHDYLSQVEWELTYLEAATCILFWVPRDLATMPAFTTNVEFGMFLRSGRIVLGYPEFAANMRYLKFLADRNTVSAHHDLFATIKSAIQLSGA